MNIRRTVHIGIVALGAALAMLAFAAVSSVSAQTEELSISSASATTGESAAVTLAASGIPDPGLGAWSVDVTYDPNVVSVAACSPDNGSVCNEAFADDTVRVVGADAAGLVGSSTLAGITFSCDSSGTSTLALTVNTFADATPADLQPIDATVVDGAVTCSAAAVEGAPTIQMESGQAAVGDQVVLNLDALNIEAPGVGAWTVDISHDNSIATATSCLPANSGVCNAGFSEDTVRATGANASGLEGDNMLAQVTYRCEVEGTTDLTLTIQVLVDATVGDPQFIETAVVNGTLLCGDLPATETPVPGATPVMEPPDAGTGDFSPGDAGFFGLLVAGLIGAGLAWLIAGFAGARFAPAGGLSLPGPSQGASERQGRRWFESARKDLTDRGLPSVIRFRRVGEPRDREQ